MDETMIVKPNPTLYISNIDWKIKKSLLKRALYSLFTRHGKVCCDEGDSTCRG
jgi:U2 small nuclear ribonucleoprotein B''